MRLLADEDVDAAIVRWLRAEGHDVRWAAESDRAQSDEELLAVAAGDARVIVTNDRDFGELVYRKRLAASGILLLRISARAQEERLAVLAAHWPVIAPRLAEHFVVVTNRRTRVRPLPVG